MARLKKPASQPLTEETSAAFARRFETIRDAAVTLNRLHPFPDLPTREQTRDLLALRDWLDYEWSATLDQVLDAIGVNVAAAAPLVTKHGLLAGPTHDEIERQLGQVFLEQPMAFRTQQRFDAPAEAPAGLQMLAPEVRAMIEQARQQQHAPAAAPKKQRRK